MKKEIDLRKNIIKLALDKYDGNIVFDEDEMELALLCYDGGDDSMRSTMFSKLLAIRLVNGEILLDLEDERDYSLERVHTIEDLNNIITAILEYDEIMQDKFN